MDWGRVSAYKDKPSDKAKGPAGWITMRDDGPEVYFTPDCLDPKLRELLQCGRLQHTRVSTRVYYRGNGHHRYTQEVCYLGDDADL